MIEQIITSSIIILVIVVLRKLLKNRISKQLQYALWLIVAIKLFVPFDWIAASFSKRDSEIACDDSVIKRLGEQERIKYGNTLVEMMGLCQKKESLFQLTKTIKK